MDIRTSARSSGKLDLDYNKVRLSKHRICNEKEISGKGKTDPFRRNFVLAHKMSESSGGTLRLHHTISLSIRYPIPTQEVDNVLITPLGLQVSMGEPYDRSPNTYLNSWQEGPSRDLWGPRIITDRLSDGLSRLVCFTLTLLYFYLKESHCKDKFRTTAWDGLCHIPRPAPARPRRPRRRARPRRLLILTCVFLWGLPRSGCLSGSRDPRPPRCPRPPPAPAPAAGRAINARRSPTRLNS
ncbi:hypothetical protein EVAR_32192_1 [Eumeta japonica]|uniref:Uncharacterized protein n=1 Tax=Eumeta variegata TaxID=151549 RepID=A0A4C1VWJ7_EUMVA|nr:hypothetical protein EVAR_32192_1 [Eumeta japonica]